MQEVTALTRADSVDKPANVELRKRGIKVIAADFEGPEEALVEILKGVDTVVSAVNWQHLETQLPLANAAKAAGVKRFVPCNFGTACPPGGIMRLEEKVGPASLSQPCVLDPSAAGMAQKHGLLTETPAELRKKRS
jgi:hypothetical protein